jgi:hypothetical protein
MNARSSRTSLILGMSLALLMAATRLDHFGSRFHLPDASLAVFFLGGILLRSPAAFLLFSLEAFSIDGLAFSLGTSTACFSPAYAFLLPTYGAMWLAGRYGHTLARSGAVAHAVALCAGTTLAFLCSSGSYYLLSPRYTDHSLAEFLTRSRMYFGPYLLTTAAYAVGAFVLARLITGRELHRVGE